MTTPDPETHNSSTSETERRAKQDATGQGGPCGGALEPKMIRIPDIDPIEPVRSKVRDYCKLSQ